MKFQIDSEIFKSFPGVCLGVVVAKGIDNTGENPEVLSLIKEKEQMIRQSISIENLSQQPRISSWRKAYSSFGAKPKKYKSSVESLYRMVLKGMSMRNINKVVDIYNYISLKHMIPVGGDDLRKVEGDIILRFAKGDETFTALNSDEEVTVSPGEVIYCDERGVLCRRWNWRECDRTKMTGETKEVIFVAEGLPPVKREEMQEIAGDLAKMLEIYCGAIVRNAVLDENLPVLDIGRVLEF
ncbi:MAG: hypothetical protein IBX60_05980 [Candidatus Aminicenantes bacterium]|nr:hypothetical protein [Candidatus Aminicenantes bacterium]